MAVEGRSRSARLAPALAGRSGYLSIEGMHSSKGKESIRGKMQDSSIYIFAADLCCSERLQQWPPNLMHSSSRSFRKAGVVDLGEDLLCMRRGLDIGHVLTLPPLPEDLALG